MDSIYAISRNKSTTHEARKSRRLGKVPGNIYSKVLGNLLFEISELELNKEICKNGEHGVIKVNVDGSDHVTLIKEIQRDPVTHKIVHIDLEELSGGKVVTTEVPIQFVGEENIVHEGGILQKEKNSVKVQCKGEDIPKGIYVDVSKLKVGEVCRLMDLEMAKEITFLDDLSSVLAAVTRDNIAVNTVESLTENGSVISRG